MTDNSHNLYVWTREHLNNVVISTGVKILRDPVYAAAFRKVDRADFVPEEYKNLAYADQTIDLGYGQKLDRPTIVAEQVRLIEPVLGGRYLEIGAGSGYTAAIIGMVCGRKGKVIALERMLFLVDKMHENLSKYPELKGVVEPVFKDGKEGYSSEAPYDGILSSVSFREHPMDLINQLKIGGRLVFPTVNYEMHLIQRISADAQSEKIIPGFIFDKIGEGVE